MRCGAVPQRIHVSTWRRTAPDGKIWTLPRATRGAHMPALRFQTPTQASVSIPGSSFCFPSPTLPLPPYLSALLAGAASAKGSLLPPEPSGTRRRTGNTRSPPSPPCLPGRRSASPPGVQQQSVEVEPGGGGRGIICGERDSRSGPLRSRWRCVVLLRRALLLMLSCAPGTVIATFPLPAFAPFLLFCRPLSISISWKCWELVRF